MSMEGPCGGCTHNELDADVCPRLSELGILHDACVYGQVPAARDDIEYPDIETRPTKDSAPGILGDRIARTIGINPDFL